MVTKTDYRDAKIRQLLEESQTGTIIGYHKKKALTIIGVSTRPSESCSSPWPADIPIAVVLEDGLRYGIDIRYVKLRDEAEKEIEAELKADQEKEKAEKIERLQAQLAKLQK